MTDKLDYDTIELSVPAYDPKVPFGKYKDQKISEITAEDPHYVVWLKENTEWGKDNITATQCEEARQLEEDDHEDEPEGLDLGIKRLFDDDIPF